MFKYSRSIDSFRRLGDRTATSFQALAVRHPLALVSLTILVFLLPIVGSIPVYEVSEAREGSVVLRILDTGEMILPLRHGEIIPSKPILFHWIAALVGKISGEFGAAELRAPSLLAAALFLLLFTYIVSLISGRSQAVVSFLVLGTSYGFVQLALDGRVDMVMLLLSNSALMLWLLAYWRVRSAGEGVQRLNRRLWLVLGCLLGLACLAKGPIGAVIPLLVIGAIVFSEEGARALRGLLRPELLLIPLIALPWYLAAGQQGSDAFLWRHLIFENLLRFVGGEGIAEKPFWFYATHVLTQAMPWVPILIAVLLIERTRFSHETFPRTRAERFLLKSGTLWFLVGIIFLSFSAGKRRAYLVPLLPGLAMALGVFLERWWSAFVCEPGGREIRRSYVSVFTTLAVAIALISVCVCSALGLAYLYEPTPGFEAFQSLSVAARKSLFAVQDVFSYFPPLYLLCVSALLLVSSFAFLIGIRVRNAIVSIIAFFTLVMIYTTSVTVFAASIKGVTHTYKYFAENLSESIPSHQVLTVIKAPSDESLDGFLFYWRRPVRFHQLGDPVREPTLYIARVSWFMEQPREWRRDVEVRMIGGRRIDQPQERFVVFGLSKPIPETITPYASSLN